MATFQYVDEDGNRQNVSGLEKVRNGALVGAPDLDPEEIVDEIEEANAKAEKEAKTAAAEVDRDDWPLKTITPADYLKKSPKGPQAELAQMMVDAGHTDVLAGEEGEEEED